MFVRNFKKTLSSVGITWVYRSSEMLGDELSYWFFCKRDALPAFDHVLKATDR
jgi:hypothetical protein